MISESKCWGNKLYNSLRSGSVTSESKCWQMLEKELMARTWEREDPDKG